MADICHIAVDWGTSSFRLWALDRQGAVLGERRSAQGLVVAAQEGFEAVLESHLAALGVGEGVPVMMCGMVGARSGWTEAAYLDVPVRLDDLPHRGGHVPSARRLIRILPGLAQRDPAHPDVMRGEETQLLALARRHHSGLACLPGTHSKWVVLEDGRVERFATFMTGELFQLLRTGSVLAPALAGEEPVDPASPAFQSGVADALDGPATLGNALFALRAGWLLASMPPEAGRARLSGLLIGAEIAGAHARFGALGTVALIAAGASAGLYRAALAMAGVAGIDELDAEACVRQGLHAAALASFRLERLPA